MPYNAYKVYEQNAVLTATPGELTLMLYNGCIKFIKQARLAMQDKKIEKKNTFLKKAQAIINELMVTLDQKQSISKELLALYDYMHRRLIEANMKNDPAILNEIEKMVTDLRDTWKQVMLITQKEKPARDRA